MANAGTHSGTSVLVKAALALAIVGALNWGLIGFFNWNLVDAILGGDAREVTSAASRVVYSLVGVAGLLALFMLPRLRSVAHRPTPSETYSP
jgi:uncharacterized protein